jgi:hypothetical protein
MSRSFYKVTKGLAQVITTGEPVFVKEINNDYATVVRAIITQNDGIIHREELFPIDQLETRFAMAKRNVDFEQFVNELRQEAAGKQFSMSKQLELALGNIQKQNVDQPVPSYRNNNGTPVIVEG